MWSVFSDSITILERGTQNSTTAPPNTTATRKEWTKIIHYCQLKN